MGVNNFFIHFSFANLSGIKALALLVYCAKLDNKK